MVRGTLSRTSLLARRVGLGACLALSAWGCLLSATDRAGWPLPASWWGTSTPVAAVAKSLDRDEPSQAVAAAELIVYRDPAGRSSAAVLAQALRMAGQAQRSALAFQIALASGWRDNETQIWGLEAALANQSPQQAAAHLDALLRITGDAAPQATWLKALEETPAGKIALADRLAQTPPWTSGWLRSSTDLPGDRITDRIELLQMARNRGLVITSSDAAATSWRMIDTHPEHALAFWNAIKGKGDSATRGIWDVDFARSPRGMGDGPFEWRRRDATGVQIVVVDPLKGSGLELSNLSNATSTIVETLTSLGPGTWRLSWQQTGSPGARIVPSCLKPGSTTAPALLHASTGKALRFSVTASCPIQKLSIESTGEAAPSSRGTIFGISVDLESAS